MTTSSDIACVVWTDGTVAVYRGSMEPGTADAVRVYDDWAHALRHVGAWLRQAPTVRVHLTMELRHGRVIAADYQTRSRRRYMLTVKIIPNDTGNPPGKLADAEIHFSADYGALAGLKLVGFAIWERHSKGGRNVTFPARSYSVNGERRSFALLRPTDAEYGMTNQNRIRDLILDAYAAHEAATVSA